MCNWHTKCQTFIFNRLWDIVITRNCSDLSGEQNYSSTKNILCGHISTEAIDTPNLKLLEPTVLQILWKNLKLLDFNVLKISWKRDFVLKWTYRWTNWRFQTKNCVYPFLSENDSYKFQIFRPYWPEDILLTRKCFSQIEWWTKIQLNELWICRKCVQPTLLLTHITNLDFVAHTVLE